MSIRDILADNFRKLREATPSLNSPKDIIKAEAASNGTIGRISKRETGISIDKLEPLANAYGIEVWQLLSPELKASPSISGMPVITGLPEWPFEEVDLDRWQKLTERQKGRIEKAVNDELDRIEMDQQQANGGLK